MRAPSERFGVAGASSPPLYDFLRDTELLEYHDRLKSMLKLRNAADLAFCEERDLSRVGMSRPEQKRLRFEFARRFPNAAAPAASTAANGGPTAPSTSLVVKLRKKMFGGGADGTISRESTSALLENGSPEEDQTTESQHVIPADRIHLCRELGRGEFGCVYQAAWHYRANDDEVLQVAVKRILPERMIANPAAFLQEAAIMTRMRHPNVVHLYGIVLDVRTVMLVSELAPCGSLLECLQCPAWREPFPIDTLCEFALQIAQGMRYLAGQRLVHRDLAARNVLVTSPTKIKIADFGLSRLLGVDEDYYRSSAKAPSTRLPAAWCSPEAIQRFQFNSASDVWAYGVTLWEMFTYGDAPWANMSGIEILHTVDVERRVLDWPDACPEEYYALMRDCWTHDTSRRPTFDTLCARLPEIAPQLLMSAVDSAHPGDWTYLQHRRGDIIVLLRKSPLPSANENGRVSRTSQRDANLWLGALRCGGGGLVGLFQPHETVAYLGEDYHNQTATGGPPDDPMTASMTGSLLSHSAAKKSTTLIGKLMGGGNSSNQIDGTAEKDKERRKLLISQPQGEVRHTGHLGADGHGFGLLNADKKELVKALTTSPTCVQSANGSVAFAPTCTFGVPPPAATDNDTGATAPPRPPTAAPRSQRLVPSAGRLSDGQIYSQSMDQQLNKAPPPALPPKTYWQRAAVPTTVPCASESELDAHVGLLQNEAQKCSAVIGKAATLPSVSSNDSRYKLADDSLNQFHFSAFNQENHKLQEDITNFSLDTMLDTSDRRPLIGENDRGTSVNVNGLIQSKLANFEAAAKAKALAMALYDSQRSPSVAADDGSDSSAIRLMSPVECDRWRKQAAQAQKKAARSLERQRNDQLWGDQSPNSSHNEETKLSALRGPFTARYLSGDQPAGDSNWSDEAQAAYKMLVQFGDRLRLTDDRFPSDGYGGSANTMEKSDLPKTIQYFNPSEPIGSCSGGKIQTNRTLLVSYSNNADRSIEPLAYRNHACGTVKTTAEDYVNDNGSSPINVVHCISLKGDPNIDQQDSFSYGNSLANGLVKNETTYRPEESQSRPVPPAVPPKPKRRNVT